MRNKTGPASTLSVKPAPTSSAGHLLHEKSVEPPPHVSAEDTCSERHIEIPVEFINVNQ